MSRIPPHGARLVGAWPASRRAARRSRQAPPSVLAAMAGLARTLHVLRAERPERRPEIGPPLPPQRA